jgi:hypothetical protein
MLSTVGDHLIAGVRQLIYQHSLPLATRDMQIVPTRYRSRAGIAGAAYLVLDHVLDPATIDEIVAGRIPSLFTSVSVALSGEHSGCGVACFLHLPELAEHVV